MLRFGRHGFSASSIAKNHVLQTSDILCLIGRRPVNTFHTQTVHWQQEEKDDSDVTVCQLVSFRSLDSNPLRAMIVNDTTSGSSAYKHLRKGGVVLYSGGDYYNARQLLNTIKRKCSPSLQKARKQKYNEKKKKYQPAKQKDAEDDIRTQWINQRQLQRKQSEFVNKILIQISMENSMPNQIERLKRVPKNVEQILSYAFQNNKDMIIDKLGVSEQPTSFLLSLSDFIGMVGGYEWNRNGVYIKAMKDYIYPHYGVFPPTRQEYIKLLDNIDSTKENTTLMEVGIGSGVLSCVLLKEQKVTHVIGTDNNPYAIACARDNLDRLGFGNHVDLIQTDIFPTTTELMDMVLFNPPWIPCIQYDEATWFEKAVYDQDQNVLRRFLLQVQNHVNEDGHVYLILSNLGILLGLFKAQDLYDMFEEGNLDLVDVHKTVPKAKATTKRSARKEKEPESIAIARAQEVISLYKLRVKKKGEEESVVVTQNKTL